MSETLIPLVIGKSQQVGDQDEILGHIEYALGLGLEELQIGLVPHDGTFVIVGSGPSVSTQLESIREEIGKYRPIMAVNGAHDYLIENGIIPTLWMTIDPQVMVGIEPRPHLHNLKYPQKSTIYCIASRAHPSTFDTLKGYKRLLFHAWGTEPENELISKRAKMAIGGGTTSGTRAFNFAYIQGFRHLRLYGFDSCLGPGLNKHIQGDPIPEDYEKPEVVVGDKSFICNKAMAQQAAEFQCTWDVMPDIHIEVLGGGLLAAIIEERKKLGLPT